MEDNLGQPQGVDELEQLKRRVQQLEQASQPLAAETHAQQLQTPVVQQWNLPSEQRSPNYLMIGTICITIILILTASVTFLVIYSVDSVDSVDSNNIDVTEGQQAPNIIGYAHHTSGWEPFELYDNLNKDQYILIQFIDTDCGHCWNGAAEISENYAEYGGEKVTVNGQVLSAIDSENGTGGEPLEDIHAMLLNLDDTPVDGYSDYTNRDGRFSLSDVPRGSFILEVSHTDYKTLRITFNPGDEADMTLTLTPGNGTIEEDMRQNSGLQKEVVFITVASGMLATDHSRAEIVAFQEKGDFVGCYNDEQNCADRPGNVHNWLYVDDNDMQIFDVYNLPGVPFHLLLDSNGTVVWNSGQHHVMGDPLYEVSAALNWHLYGE